MKISDYKVIILCGGKGTRISEHSLITPKPMIKIGNFPILLHILNHYFHFNIKKFILTIGYKGDQITKYFTKIFPKIKNLKKKIIYKKKYIKIIYSNDIEITLIKTGIASETGGRILQCRSFFRKNEIFFLTYGDGLSNINILDTLNDYKKLKKIGLVSAVRPPARFGKLNIKKNVVVKFEEKNQINEGWINGGFFIFNTKIFKYIKSKKTNFEMYSLKNLSKDKELIAKKHYGFWQCMDTLREKIILEKLFKNKIHPWISKKYLI